MNIIYKCPVCEESEHQSVAHQLQHKLLKCGRCNLIYSERVADPDIVRFYTENQNNFFDQPYFDAFTKIEQHPEYLNYRDALRRIRPLIKGPRLLDVGSGTGALLEVAAQVGFDPEGLEVATDVAARGSGKFKIHFYDGDSSRLPDLSPFDVIVLWDVLEHLNSPPTALKALKKILNPNGVILIRTINENCLLTQVSLILKRVGIASAAKRMHEIYHVVYFTESTLNQCLKEAELVPLSHWWGEFPVERVSRSSLVRIGLRFAYRLQRLFNRTYEQYVIAGK